MKKSLKKVMALTMAFTMLCSVGNAFDSEAASKPKLSQKTVTVKKGKSAKVNVKGKKIKSTTWSIKNKKIAKITKKTKTSAKIKGIKAGKTYVTAKVKVGKKRYTLRSKIVVKGNPVEPKVTATPIPATPTPSASAPTGTAAASQSPAASDPTPDPTDNNDPEPTLIPIGTKVIDATFEKYTPGQLLDETTTTFDYFTNRDTSTSCTATISDEGYAEEGALPGNCLLITGRTSQYQGALLNLTDIVEPGAVYDFEAYVRLGEDAAPGAQLTLSSEVQAVAGREAYNTLAQRKCPKEWVKVSYELSAPDDVAHFGIYFEVWNDPTCEIYIDNASLTLKDRNTPLSNLPSLKEVFKDKFDYFGVAVDYNALFGENSSSFMKSQYNSITMGNEMKPDAIIDAGNTISQADAQEAGYYIPEEYAAQEENQDKNGNVIYPKLNFDDVDAIIKEAHDKNLKLRAHTLIWHEQTPVSFFKTGYSVAKSAANCSKAAMDTRIELYVKTVVNHMLASEYSDCIYAWDVVNEYFHSHNAKGRDKPTYWEEIYGKDDSDNYLYDVENKMSTRPSYVKWAFVCAYEALKENHREEDIALFYNDFNTYGGSTASDIVEMIGYINEEDSLNADGTKICAGVGMQSHLDISDPYHSVANFAKALNTFKAAGIEIQITELDATMDPSTESDSTQAEYYKQLFQALLAAKADGAKITSVTIWGMYDSCSWRKEKYPLVFKGINNPKEAFYSIIEAAEEEAGE